MPMIAAIRRMILLFEGKRVTPESLSEIGQAYDFRIALAALLVHAGNVDGDFVDAEKQSIRDLLVRQLGVPPVEARELMVLVNFRNLQEQEIDELVEALTERLGPEGRVHLIEWLWEIVVADRIVTDDETELIANLASRLGVETYKQREIASRYLPAPAA
jgi:uncharacterized tellurite resistance protein B-like protein